MAALVTVLDWNALGTAPNDSIYAILNCDNQSRVIEINVSSGESSVVYTAPDSLGISDITISDDATSIYIARVDRNSNEYPGTRDVIQFNMHDHSVTPIAFEWHSTDNEFAISSHGLMVFASARNIPTGLYLLETTDGTMKYLTQAAYDEGGYPIWSHDSQAVWFVDTDRRGWNITSIDIRDPEKRTIQFVGKGVIGPFAIRESDSQMALIASHLVALNPDTWSGINLVNVNGDVVLHSAINAYQVMYHNNDLYYLLWEWETQQTSLSRLDPSTGQSERLFESECILAW